MPPPRRITPPPPRISSRHSPPSGRRRSPDRRRPPSRGAPRGGGISSSTRGRSRQQRRSPPLHAPPQQRPADSRSRPRRSRSPIPTRIRTPPPIQRARSPPPIQRIRTPLPPAPIPRSFPVASGSPTKRKVPIKEQRGRMPERGHENGSQRSGSRSVISPPRKMIRSRSPRPRQEIPLIGPADDPVPRDYRSRSSMTYNVAMSPPDSKSRLIPPLPLTDRFRNEGTNVFKGPEGGFNMSELRSTRVHIILKPQSMERNELDPAHSSVVRRPELLGVDRHILEERGHYHPHHHRSEGSKPIFARDEIMQASHSPAKVYEPKYEPSEHERIITVDNRPALREGSRYTSPGRYESERLDGPSTSRDSRYNSNDDYRPTREYDRPTSSFDQRESVRPERQGGDLRQQLEYRHDPARYSSERGRPQDQNSDLRARLVEKRTDRHEERPFVDRPVQVEHERRPSPAERRRPVEVTERSRHPPEAVRHHHSPDARREFEVRRSPEPRRESGSSSRRPRGDFESRPSRAESGSSRRPPRDTEVVRRRRDESSPPPHYHRGNPEEYSDHPPKEWDTSPEHVPRGGGYFEHDNREDEMPHASERGRGRGMTRMRGSNYRGRGQRGGPMVRGGSSIRGVRPSFRGAPYSRGGYPPRRGYVPRSGRKSSPKWEHDMFDSLSDQPAS